MVSGVRGSAHCLSVDNCPFEVRRKVMRRRMDRCTNLDNSMVLWVCNLRCCSEEEMCDESSDVVEGMLFALLLVSHFSMLVVFLMWW